MKRDLPIDGVTGGNSIHRFKGNWIVSDDKRTYEEYQSRLYYSDSKNKLQKSSDGIYWSNVGIDKPQGDYSVDLISYKDKLALATIKSYPFNNTFFKVEILGDNPFNWWAPKGSYQLGITPVRGYIRYKNKTLMPIEFAIGGAGAYIQWWDNDGHKHDSVEGAYIKTFGENKPNNYIFRPKQTGTLPHNKTGGKVGTGAWIGSEPLTSRTLATDYPDGIDDYILGGKQYDFVIRQKETPVSDEYSYTQNVSTPNNTFNQYRVGDVKGLRRHQIDISLTSKIELVTSQNVQPSEYRVFQSIKGDLQELGNVKETKGQPTGTQNTYTIYDTTKKEKQEAQEKFKVYFTLYNENDGTESEPKMSDDITAEFPISIDLSKIDVSDPQVTHIRVYLQGLNIAKPTLISEVLVASSSSSSSSSSSVTITKQDFVDNMEIVLDTYNNTPPPTGLSMLTSHLGIMFGYKGSTLHYSNIGQPNYWGKFNYITFDNDITGIASTLNGLLVFTRGKTFIITGSSHETFSKHLLDSSTGCISPNSIQQTRQNVIWQSVDSICLSNGGAIVAISRNHMGQVTTPEALCSALHNDVYYLSFSDHTLVCDMREGVAFVIMTDAYSAMFRDIQDDKLYASTITNLVVEVCGDPNRNKRMRYVSPKFASGSVSDMKVFKNFYTNASGDIDIKVILDDEVAYDSKVAKGVDELKVAQDKMRSYYCQFIVEGEETLNEIEFKTEGKQNGR